MRESQEDIGMLGSVGTAHSLPPHAATAGTAQYQDRISAEYRGAADLTKAEWRVMRLVAEGLTNRQVARRLNCSPHTVNYHLRGIFRKLGIGSRVMLARAYSRLEHRQLR